MASKIPNIKLTTTISSSTKSFFCEPCTINEVFLKIMQLNEKKSTGILNIPIKFIKMSAEFLSSVLAKIFNTCMQIGIFPSLLKIEKITKSIKMGALIQLLIIVRYQLYHLFQKYLKTLYTID